MAPLDRFTYSPLPSETYITFHDNQWDKHYYILSQRDVIVGAHPLYEFETSFPSPSTSSSSQPQSRTNSFQTLMELLTDNLCLCPHQQQRMRQQRAARDSASHNTMVPNPAASQKNIVYPVARYPDRLNSPELVQQRRKSLQHYSTFVPVVVE